MIEVNNLIDFLCIILTQAGPVFFTNDLVLEMLKHFFLLEKGLCSLIKLILGIKTSEYVMFFNNKYNIFLYVLQQYIFYNLFHR